MLGLGDGLGGVASVGFSLIRYLWIAGWRTRVTQATHNLMPTLYKRLKAAGVDPAYVKKTVLPSWWDDEDASNPAAYSQALITISRNLAIPLSVLHKADEPIDCDAMPHTKFKRQTGTKEGDIKWSHCIATRAARIAAMASEQSPLGPIGPARKVRERINATNSCVSLTSLMDFCWDNGIPVLHVANFPKGSKKMDGMATIVDTRPVIVLSKNCKHSAWLLFILAHEMGHIASGHIKNGDVLLDEKVSVDGTKSDPEEVAADQYAIELLTGKPLTRYRATGTWPKAAELVSEAKRIGAEARIDPGAVVLNYAHAVGHFPVGNAALNILEPEANAVGSVNRAMVNRLNMDGLGEEHREFLCRVTNAKSGPQ
jgi:hypothetical protein